MKKIHRRFLSLLCLFALTPAMWAGIKIELLTFADLVTAKDVKPKWSWHSIGIDPDDNVYAVVDEPSGPNGDLADRVLVQYQARTGRRRGLGLLSEAAKAAGTLRPGEHIDKRHSQIRKGGIALGGITIRTESWPYTEWNMNGPQGTQFNDHDSAPRELLNFAELPQHTAMIGMLRQQLRAVFAANIRPAASKLHRAAV